MSQPASGNEGKGIRRNANNVIAHTIEMHAGNIKKHARTIIEHKQSLTVP
jgi:hypothetical protein